MSYNTELYWLPENKEFIRNSLDENSHLRSNSHIQTAQSQKHPNIAKCESTSTDNDEFNDCLSVIEKAEAKENDKYEADKIISIVDEKTRNNSEVKFLSFFYFSLSFSSSNFLGSQKF